jgi:hypothetical protein
MEGKLPLLTLFVELLCLTHALLHCSVSLQKDAVVFYMSSMSFQDYSASSYRTINPDSRCNSVQLQFQI